MVLPWQLLADPWFQLFLSIPVYTVGFLFFGRSAWHSLKNGVPNMDVLIFMGAFSSFAYSIAGMILFWGSHEIHKYLFFETGATIITLVLLGNVIEKRSVMRTTTALKELAGLQVKKARMLRVDGEHEDVLEVEIEKIVPGDILLVNSGDSIPIDAEVVRGNGSIDEAMITGESLPVYKNAGDKVIGGTLLVEGNLRIKASTALHGSVLSGIIELVKNAQAAKPAIQKMGDKVSAVFVPVVLIISILTFLLSYFIFSIDLTASLMRSVAVLVISCPCAMGLATPTAVMVGIGKAARRGILIKGGDTLEAFAKTNCIIFDKTGTLSTGAFVVQKLMVFEGEEQEIKNLIYNMELGSSHPIAKSIVKNHKDWFKSNLAFATFEEHKGSGISVTGQAGDEYRFGSAKFMNTALKENGYDLYLFKNNKPMAALRIEDSIKNNAAEVLRYLEEQNIETVLLSGDKKEKVLHVAEKLGMQEALYEQLPQQKLTVIENKMADKHLAMLGDGINDAPSLSKAEVGISFSDGTDVARQSANIVLMRKDLRALVDAHIISKQTYRTIKQNLFWAFFYNAIAIPFAAAGFMHPMLGALSMAFSDVVVIGNSLRLRFTKV